MSWTDPSGGSAVTGGTALSTDWNTYLISNLEALAPDGVDADAWSPTLEGTTADPSVGTVTAVQYQVGALMHVWATFVADGDGTGSGTYFVELPVAAVGLDDSANGGGGQAIGSWQARDNDTPANNEGGAVQLRSGTTVMFNRPVGGVVTNSTPFTWGDALGGSGDVLSFHAVYPVA